MLSILLKSLYSKVVFYTGGVSRALANKNKSGAFLILMYHRVTLPSKTIEPGMYVTPDTFDRHLQYLSKKFTVLSLPELLVILADNERQPFKKPVCVITFDDGWKDFYDNAFPLLSKHGLPATLFLPTAYIGSKDRFWTDIFASFLLRKQDVSADMQTGSDFREVMKQLDTLHGGYQDKLEQGIELLKKLPRAQIIKLLNELSAIWGISDDSDERNFISWSEVEEMKASKLITFGSHTVSHEILTTIKEDEVRNELVKSKNDLLEKGVMDSSCQSFCYPNGGLNSEIAEIVQDTGYHIAVTTKAGWIHKDDNLMTLKRVGVHQDMTSSVPLFASRIAGFI